MSPEFIAAYDKWLAACKRYNERTGTISVGRSAADGEFADVGDDLPVYLDARTVEAAEVQATWDAVLAIEPNEDKIFDWEHYYTPIEIDRRVIWQHYLIFICEPNADYRAQYMLYVEAIKDLESGVCTPHSVTYEYINPRY
jgi:hypothetical protein